MTTADDILGEEVVAKIQDILRTCSIHRASVSFRTKAHPSNTNRDRTLTWETQGAALHTSLVVSPTDGIFHIASITKILVATATVHAIEVKALASADDNPWSKFKKIGSRPIKKVYDQYKKPSDPDLPFLPRDPTVYEFIVHSKGLPSCNDVLFAPDGTPLMNLQDVPRCLSTLLQRVTNEEGLRRWTVYSNMNFAVIALVIEACWEGSLDNFMEETLFKPLSMHSTSIGSRSSSSMISNNRWTVDQDGKRQQVQTPAYRPSGAEAAALGAYSTIEDLNKFFLAIISASDNVTSDPMQGFDRTIDTMLRIENKSIQDVMHFTPFGLETTLGGSSIGLLSTSGLQFREEAFTRYPVIPDGPGQNCLIYYMAGSAVGCSCATALRIDTGDDFALTVLTDTSGPVAVADHILRIILRRYVDLQQQKLLSRLRSLQRDSVRKMVAQTKEHVAKNWEDKKRYDQRMRKTAHPEPFDIQGIYDEVGFPQRLHVVKQSDGKTYLSVSGVSTQAVSGNFELLWKDDAHLWLCVPPHMSIDRLDNGDWADLLFEVARGPSGAMELKRGREDGVEYRYIRQT